VAVEKTRSKKMMWKKCYHLYFLALGYISLWSVLSSARRPQCLVSPCAVSLQPNLLGAEISKRSAVLQEESLTPVTVDNSLV